MLQTLKAVLTPPAAGERHPVRHWEWERATELPHAHHSDAAGAAARCRREGNLDEAERILRWCIDYVEAESRGEYVVDVPPGYHERLADLYRETGCRGWEREVLERYVETVRGLGGTPHGRVVERLESLSCE